MKIALLFTAFLFAFFANTQAQTNQSNHKTTAEPVTDFCTLFDEAGKYEGQTVKTHAFLSYTNVSRVDGGDTFLFSPKCNNEDYFALIVTKSSRLWSYLSHLPQEQSYVLEVTVRGRLTTSLFAEYGHLAWSRAQMRVDHWESIKNVTKSRPNVQPSDEDGPIIETSKAIKALNVYVSEWIFSIRNTADIQANISTEFILTDETGKTYKLDDIGSFQKRQIFANADKNAGAVGLTDLTATGGTYKAVGFVEIGKRSSPQLSFGVENTFRMDGDIPILIQTLLTRR
jgi:hypothetical protein